MTLFTDVRKRDRALYEMPSSMSSFLGASLEEARYLSPTAAMKRDRELYAAEGVSTPALDFMRGLGGRVPEFSDEQLRELGIGDSPILPKEEAIKRAKEAGNFTFEIPDDGIREGALDILIERAYERRKRDAIFARRPAGWSAALAGFGASLVGAMMDPINIAASFVPVVGPTRYGAMLAKASGPFSRALVRTRVGAVEGAVGNIAVEPFVLAAARHEQDDYGMADALLNVALGTVLGAGLHVSGGAALDAVRAGRPWQRIRARPDEPLPRILEQTSIETRQAALRTGVAQAATGRQVDVTPIVGPIIAQADRVGSVRVNDLIGQTDGVRRPPIMREGSPEFQALGFARQRIERDYRLASEIGVIDDIERLAAERKTARQSSAELGAKLERIETIGRLNHETAQDIQANKETLVRAVRSKLDIPGQDETTEFAKWLAAYQARVEMTGPARAFRDAERLSSPKLDKEAVREAARRSFEPENQRSADFEASRTAEARMAEAPKDDAMPEATLEAAMEDLRATARAFGDEELISRELGEFDDLAKTADEYGRAVKAAADCQLRRAA